MTYAQFADALRPLVATFGARHSGELCGVDERTIRLWLRAEAKPNKATMRGALEILRESQPGSKERSDSDVFTKQLDEVEKALVVLKAMKADKIITGDEFRSRARLLLNPQSA